MAAMNKRFVYSTCVGYDSLRATRYDLVAGVLLSSLFMVAFAVTILFALWVTSFKPIGTRLAPFPITEFGEAETPLPDAGASLEEPGNEEISELVEPELAPAIDAVTELVSTQAAGLDGIEAFSTPGGLGKGETRVAGPPGGPLKPRWERWQIRYNVASISEYTQQLDHFQVELAAAGGGRKQVDYAYQLGQRRPETRRASGSDETRLRFSWKSGKLREFDRRLLLKAGIPTSGRAIMQFLPKTLETQLVRLEQEYAAKQSRSVEECQSTLFGVRSTQGGYEFYVVSMQFREQRNSGSVN